MKTIIKNKLNQNFKPKGILIDMKSQELLNDELSEFELTIMLDKLVCEYVTNQENIVLIKDILDKLYTEEESVFFLKLIKALNNNIEERKIIDEYANNNYKNEMLCRNGSKYFWQIEARILLKRGYPKVQDIINNLFEWLQDLNWPGSNEIIDLLLMIPKEEFIKGIEYSIEQAQKDKDYDWIMNMKYICEKKKLTINDFNNQDLYQIMINCDI